MKLHIILFLIIALLFTSCQKRVRARIGVFNYGSDTALVYFKSPATNLDSIVEVSPVDWTDFMEMPYNNKFVANLSKNFTPDSIKMSNVLMDMEFYKNHLNWMSTSLVENGQDIQAYRFVIKDEYFH